MVFDLTLVSGVHLKLMFFIRVIIRIEVFCTLSSSWLAGKLKRLSSGSTGNLI